MLSDAIQTTLKTIENDVYPVTGPLDRQPKGTFIVHNHQQVPVKDKEGVAYYTNTSLARVIGRRFVNVMNVADAAQSAILALTGTLSGTDIVSVELQSREGDFDEASELHYIDLTFEIETLNL